MKLRSLMLPSLVAASLLVPTFAIAAAINTVFIEKDAAGADHSIHIAIHDAQDVATLKEAFGAELTLADAGQSFRVDCSAGASCRISFHERGAVYRQRYDEAVKGFDLSAASAAVLFGGKWQAPLAQTSCGADDCSHFEVKSFVDAEGKFSLQCNARVRASTGERLAPNCFMRFDIRDVLRAERG